MWVTNLHGLLGFCEAVIGFCGGDMGVGMVVPGLKNDYFNKVMQNKE